MTRRAEFAILSSKSNAAAGAMAGISRWRVLMEITESALQRADVLGTPLGRKWKGGGWGETGSGQ